MASDSADGEDSAKGLVRTWFCQINSIAVSNKKVSCSLGVLESAVRFTGEQGSIPF